MTNPDQPDPPKTLTPTEISAKLRAPFPEDAIKQRKGVGGGKLLFDYLTHGDVTERLIEATGNQFDWQIIDDRLIGDVHIVQGRLTIPGLGSRDEFGTAKVYANQEDSYKSAASDAFKRASMRFGPGLQLYRSDEAEHGGDLSQPPQPPGGQPPTPPVRYPARNSQPPQKAPESPTRGFQGQMASEGQVKALSALLRQQGRSPVLVDWRQVTPAIASAAITAIQNERFSDLPQLLNGSVDDVADRVLFPNSPVPQQQDRWVEIVKGVSDPVHFGRLITLAKRAVSANPEQLWRFWTLVQEAKTANTVAVVMENVALTKVDQQSERYTSLVAVAEQRLVELAPPDPEGEQQ